MMIDSSDKINPKNSNIPSSPFREHGDIGVHEQQSSIGDEVIRSSSPLKSTTHGGAQSFTGNPSAVFDLSSPIRKRPSPPPVAQSPISRTNGSSPIKDASPCLPLNSGTDIDDQVDDDYDDMIISQVSVARETVSDPFTSELDPQPATNRESVVLSSDEGLIADDKSTRKTRNETKAVLRDLGLSDSSSEEEEIIPATESVVIQSSSQPRDTVQKSSNNLVDQIAPSSSAPPETTSSSKRRKPPASQQKEQEREAKRAKKEAAQKEREARKALEEANKDKTKTKTSAVKEIIVEMDHLFHDTPNGAIIRESLDEIGAEIRKWNRTLDGVNLIRFLRKVQAEYDYELQMYQPLEKVEIREDNKAIIIVSGEMFAEIVNGGLVMANIHLDEIRKLLPNKHIVYIIENLQAVLKRTANETNREYANRVRELMDENQGSQQQPRQARRTNSKSKNGVKVDELQVDQFLLDFQFTHGFKVIQTASQQETADWVVDLVPEVGSAPYKSAKLLTNEMFDVGNITSGKTIQDTFAKSLEKIKYVTPSISQSVSKYYGNPCKFTSNLSRRGKSALEGLRTSSNGKAVNKALAKSIADIFLCKDPDQFLAQN